MYPGPGEGKPFSHVECRYWYQLCYRSHRTHWPGRCARLHALPVPPSYVGNFIGCQFVNANYKIAVITYKTRSTGTPAYLSHLIRDCLPARTLRSSDCTEDDAGIVGESLQCQTVSAPSVWNSLTYTRRSAELRSTFRHNLKLSYLILLTVNVNTRPSLCHLCASDSLATYGAIKICF